MGMIWDLIDLYNFKEKRAEKVRTTFPDMYEHSFNNLIKNLTIDHKDQVWCTDISCICTIEGILYASGIMDIFSHKIISFNVIALLRTEGSLDCLQKALKQVANPPDRLLNTLCYLSQNLKMKKPKKQSAIFRT